MTDQLLEKTTVDNQVGGNMTDSLQVGVVNTFNFFQQLRSAPLRDYVVTESEIEKVQRNFVAPGNFASAARVLAQRGVVILLGKGSGRGFAGLRLLVEHRSRIVYLNPNRSMTDVKDNELADDGYLWDLSGHGDRPFTTQEFDRIRQLIKGHRCLLVLVLDDVTQVPSEAHTFCVELRAPDPYQLAREEIEREWRPGGMGDPQRVLRDDFAAMLAVDTPPVRALQAAELAIRVAKGGLRVEDAKQEFGENFDREVENTMDSSWSTMEYTMMFTVALLQDKPFEEVVAAQRELDDLVRQDELPQDKALRPRRAFVKPNDAVLRRIGAQTELRDNPVYPELSELTVRFKRSDWAEPVLRRIWQHYHVDHDRLLKWMCGPRMSEKYFEESVRALSTLIRGVPARDRLWPLHRLVTYGGTVNLRLAAAVLAQVENVSAMRTLVAQTVSEWRDGGKARQKIAVVYYAGFRFSESNARPVLSDIATIARDKRPTVHEACVGTVLDLMSHSKAWKIFFDSIISWAEDAQSGHELDGLRPVALHIGACLFRLVSDSPPAGLVEVSTLIEQHPDECRRLVELITMDLRYGDEAVSVLYERCRVLRSLVIEDEKIRDYKVELVAIMHLLASDLRWWRRLPVVFRLCRRHPSRRREIRYIFRVARAMEKSGDYSVPSSRLASVSR